MAGNEPERLPRELVGLCDEFDLDPPTPGERWEFVTPDGEYDYEEVRRTLVQSGCKLHQNFRTPDGRRWEYTVPEPGWPDPLGHVTTDEPEWVDPQTYWTRQGSFKGNVRGSIPDAGDCERHPDLPPDSFALSGVSILPPTRTAKYHAKPPIERPDGSWCVQIKHEQVNRSYRTKVYVYAEQLGEFPFVQEWKASPHTNTERRHVAFFDTCGEAVRFVERETELTVPSQGGPDGT